MYEDLALYINGEFITGGGRERQDIINPSTLEVLAKLPHATEQDLDNALEAAQKALDRKSTRLNSSHVAISYAVFCLKKKKKRTPSQTSVNTAMWHGWTQP